MCLAVRLARATSADRARSRRTLGAKEARVNIRPSEKSQKARSERLVTDLGVVVCSFPDGFVQRSSVEPNGSFDRGAQWKTLEMHGLFVETLRHRIEYGTVQHYAKCSKIPKFQSRLQTRSTPPPDRPGEPPGSVCSERRHGSLRSHWDA